jgi:hypothetical protein
MDELARVTSRFSDRSYGSACDSGLMSRVAHLKMADSGDLCMPFRNHANATCIS